MLKLWHLLQIKTRIILKIKEIGSAISFFLKKYVSISKRNNMGRIWKAEEFRLMKVEYNMTFKSVWQDAIIIYNNNKYDSMGELYGM